MQPWWAQVFLKKKNLDSSTFLTCCVLCYNKYHIILNHIMYWRRNPWDIYIYTSSFGEKNTLLYLLGTASESDHKTCLWIFRFHNTWSVIYCTVSALWTYIHTYTESFNRHWYMLIAATAQWTMKLPIQHSAQLGDLSCFLPPYAFWLS